MPTPNTDFPIAFEETPVDAKAASYYDLVGVATGQSPRFELQFPETPNDNKEAWYYEQIWLGTVPPLIIF